MNGKHRYEILLKDASDWLAEHIKPNSSQSKHVQHVYACACVRACVQRAPTHLKELVGRAVVGGARGGAGGVVAAPVQLAEAVDAVEVTGVQLGQVDVREV